MGKGEALNKSQKPPPTALSKLSKLVFERGESKTRAQHSSQHINNTSLFKTVFELSYNVL